jgi:hypothetical protein
MCHGNADVFTPDLYKKQWNLVELKKNELHSCTIALFILAILFHDTRTGRAAMCSMRRTNKQFSPQPAVLLIAW